MARPEIRTLRQRVYYSIARIGYNAEVRADFAQHNAIRSTKTRAASINEQPGFGGFTTQEYLNHTYGHRGMDWSYWWKRGLDRSKTGDLAEIRRREIARDFRHGLWNIGWKTGIAAGIAIAIIAS